MAQMRSITPCSSGASSGETSRPCMANIVSLSEKKYCANRNASAMTRATTPNFGAITKKAVTKTT